MAAFEEHFEQRPAVAGGALVLRGTRVPVRGVLASLAEGASEANILRGFPTVTAAQVRAAVMFAASIALVSAASDALGGDAG